MNTQTSNIIIQYRYERAITSNHRQIGVNIVALLNRFYTSSVKFSTTNFSIHASECPVFIMNQLKSVYSIPFLDSYPHLIHICLSMIAPYLHYTQLRIYIWNILTHPLSNFFFIFMRRWRPLLGWSWIHNIASWRTWTSFGYFKIYKQSWCTHYISLTF